MVRNHIRIGTDSMLPPLVKLATSAAPGERKYICLAGAGLSIDAGLPTAWGLMLKTASLLRVENPGDETKDIQTWFLESEFASLPYSELIGGLFPTAVEQQSFMRKELKADKPGKSHQLIAELAKRGVIRCVITTNFDDLIEKALFGVGIPYQIIANDDDLKHSEPLIHCKQFRIYKPHGTIGVGRIRNTPEDLKKLSNRMEAELVRVTRDHGLMVIGYSGEDESIRRVFEKRKQSHYPTFWINPAEPKPAIPPLFGSETFTHVACKGAASCLTDLLEMYGKLALLAPAASLPASVLSVTEAIRGSRADAGTAVRDFMETLLGELTAIAPKFQTGGEADDLLMEALEKSKPLIIEFASVAKAIAVANSENAGLALYKAFGKIIEEYYSKGNSGASYNWSFDFWKFIGHELFVTFMAMLIRESRWELIATLLGETIYFAKGEDYRPGVVQYFAVAQYVQLLDEIRNRRMGLNRISVRADLLHERHTSGDLAKAIPAAEFMEADLFLFMRSEAHTPQPDDYEFVDWIPYSVLFMNSGPRFLFEAISKRHAERLLQPLDLENIVGFRELVKRAPRRLSRVFNSRGGMLYHFNSDDIGSQ